MDPVTMAFYGIVCGALAAVAPSLGKTSVRIVVGVAVGIVAVLVLPAARRAIGM